MKKEDYIPKVDPATMLEMAFRIRPCVVKSGYLHYIKVDTDIFTTSFLWDAKPMERAENLTMLQDITTYHTYGYHGFFKPSIAEVMAQIAQLPADVQAKVVAFELIHKPENAADLREEQKALNAGLHVATARLYAMI